MILDVQIKDKEFKVFFREFIKKYVDKNLTVFNKLKFINLNWQVTTLFSSFSHTCIDIKSANTNWSSIDKLPLFCTAVRHMLFLITSLYIYGRNQCAIACYTSKCDTKQQILTANLKSFHKAACTDRTMYFEHVGLTQTYLRGKTAAKTHKTGVY